MVNITTIFHHHLGNIFVWTFSKYHMQANPSVYLFVSNMGVVIFTPWNLNETFKQRRRLQTHVLDDLSWMKTYHQHGVEDDIPLQKGITLMGLVEDQNLASRTPPAWSPTQRITTGILGGGKLGNTLVLGISTCSKKYMGGLAVQNSTQMLHVCFIWFIYLYTFGWFLVFNMVNAGKYTIHGFYGIGKLAWVGPICRTTLSEIVHVASILSRRFLQLMGYVRI